MADGEVEADTVESHHPAAGDTGRRGHQFSTKQKLFLISSRLALQDRRIRELWNYRFIHLVEPNYDHIAAGELLRTYSVYSMDYGRLVSLRLNRESAILAEE